MGGELIQVNINTESVTKKHFIFKKFIPLRIRFPNALIKLNLGGHRVTTSNSIRISCKGIHLDKDQPL